MTLNSSEIAAMRSTVNTVQLDMTCGIERLSFGAEDAYGHRAETWVSLVAGVACHYWEMAAEELVGDQNAVLTRERIVLPANTDVREGDRIIDVFETNDLQIVADNLDVREVLHRLNDVVLVVRSIQ